MSVEVCRCVWGRSEVLKVCVGVFPLIAIKRIWPWFGPMALAIYFIIYSGFKVLLFWQPYYISVKFCSFEFSAELKLAPTATFYTRVLKGKLNSPLT